MAMVAGSIQMTDSEFERLADTALTSLERAIEESLPDADIEAKGSGVMEVQFENGTKLVINRHTAAREIWVAAKSGGLHFRHDGAAWRDARGGEELFAALSRLVSAQGGSPVLLRPRTASPRPER